MVKGVGTKRLGKGRVDVGIGDSFPSGKAELYDVIPLKLEQLFT